MDTRKMATEYRLGHWAQIMRERRESGQNVRTFCENVGICENVYYYWQRKVREAASKQMTEEMKEKLGTTKIGMAAKTLSTPPGFMEVRIAETPMQSGGERSQGNHIYIEVSGVKIKASEMYPTEKLAVLIRELARQ